MHTWEDSLHYFFWNDTNVTNICEGDPIEPLIIGKSGRRFSRSRDLRWARGLSIKVDPVFVWSTFVAADLRYLPSKLCYWLCERNEYCVCLTAHQIGELLTLAKVPITSMTREIAINVSDWLFTV